jgi:AraC-like DNA-binding protein
MAITTKNKLTRREALVREVKREYGMKWREVADQLGFESIGGMMGVLASGRPHDGTLTTLREWLRRHGRTISLDALAR